MPAILRMLRLNNPYLLLYVEDNENIQHMLEVDRGVVFLEL